MRLAARVSTLVVAVLVISGRPVSAHPLGNFTVNHYSGLEIRANGLSIDYVLDLAEIPAFQLRGAIAPDPSAACATLARDLAVTLDGAALALRVDRGTVSFPPGQAGLETLRLECGFGARWTLDARPHQLAFADRSYPERIGWREITARADDVAIDTVLPSASRSARLTAYPQDAYTSSPDARSAEVRITPGAAGASQPASSPSPLGQGDLFFGWLGRVDVGALPALLAVVVAAALGALHAATPGHGKTIMAAYLVGTRRSARDAVTLGLTVAVAHTIGVLVLAIVLIGGATVFSAERIYPILSAISALVVVALGLGMLRQQLSHRAAHRHSHEHSHTLGTPARATSLVALGLAGGMVPSASALVLLLGAVAAHRAELGILLVAAFGVGMAATLVGAGIALVAAGRLFVRAPMASRLAGFAPLVTALAVLTVGLGLTAQSLSALL